MNKITSVILCGGSGTRLWPLSRKSLPKQFVTLLNGKSLLQLTLERLAPLGGKVLCVAAEDHRFLVADNMDEAGACGTVILEPCARNTAAAMALAALHLEAEGETDQLLLFCPADHHIPDIAAFTAMVQDSRAPAEAGAIVTFGIAPSFPSTAYGYIEQGAENPLGGHQVARFIEKPDLARAQALLLQGNVVWNAGIFLTRTDTLLRALNRHAPDILGCCRAAMALGEIDHPWINNDARTFVRPSPDLFSTCRSESIDYAVMEKHDQLTVMKFNGQWSDVGSWNAVANLTPSDTSGNQVLGQGMAFLAHDTYVHAPHRPVVALGTQNLLIIDTPDAVLVVDRDHVEQVKSVVSELDRQHTVQAQVHRKIHRPWGWYDGLGIGERFQVKHILVKPGASLSLQLHQHRAEHWVVVAGTAEVTIGHTKLILTENQSTFIPCGEVHRLANPGPEPLEIIEVQSGSYLGEDDIVRLDDTYGRK